MAGLWFPWRIIADRSEFLVASSIGDRCYWEPLWNIPLFCLYSHGDEIFWISLWGPGTLIHNIGGFLDGLSEPL